MTISEQAELKGLSQKINEKESKKDKVKKSDEIDVEMSTAGKERARVTKRDQFRALFIKSATLQKRDSKTVCCQALTPFVLVIILYLVRKSTQLSFE